VLIWRHSYENGKSNYQTRTVRVREKSAWRQRIYWNDITDVKGRGEQKGITLEYRGGLMTVDFLPKIQLEIVVRDSDVDNLVVTITEAARTGKIGDGKIFIMPIEKSIRIRTGDMET
jgi:nitrogen regulatory protein P-II 1